MLKLIQDAPFLRTANLVLVILILIQYFAVSSKLFPFPANGGDDSDRDGSYFQPAPWTFAIWFLIHTLLISYGFYQYQPSTYDNEAINAISLSITINLIANIAWVVFFGLKSKLEFPTIIVLALTLIIVFLRLQKFKLAKEAFIVKLTFSVYLAWVLVANIVDVYANFTTREEKYIPYALAGLIFAFVLETTFSFYGNEPVISLVGAWAFSGIAYQQKDVVSICSVASVLAVIFGVYAVFVTIMALTRGGHDYISLEEAAVLMKSKEQKSEKTAHI